MFTKYIEAALKKAEYKKLDDNTWFGEIPGFNGVWANTSTVENCRSELIEVLEEWLILKIKDNDPLPTIDNLNISIRKTAV
jgi:predicted RNase H-like HicB family nuclease